MSDKEKIHSEVVQRIISELCLEAEDQAARIYSTIYPQARIYIQYNKVVAKNVEESDGFADHGDLHVFKDKSNDYNVIEVKRVLRDNYYAYFQEGKDFLRGVIVDGVYQLTKKNPMPILYITFNYPLTHFFLSYPVRDFDKYTKREEDTSQGRKLFYFAKTVDCKFYSVKEFFEKNSP